MENAVSSMGFIKLQKNVKWERLYFQPTMHIWFQSHFRHHSYDNALLLLFSSFRFTMFSVYGPVFGFRYSIALVLYVRTIQSTRETIIA